MDERYVRLNEVQYAGSKKRAAELAAQGFALAPLETEAPTEVKAPPADDERA